MELAVSERELDRAIGLDGESAVLWPRMGTVEHVRRCIARAADSLDFNGEPFRYPAPLADLVGRADARRTVPSSRDRASLRASIAAYARRLREDGLPPERMLVRVKHAVYEAAPRPLVAAALMHDIVRWSIDSYYGV